MAIHISELWRPQGSIGRAKYAGVGLILFALKHNIDRIVATFFFNREWSIFNYWIPNEGANINDVSFNRLWFYAVLVAIAIPFIWIGVILTLKRLRSIGLPLWLVAVFFIPFLNLFFFLLLSVLPAGSAVVEANSPLARGPRQFLSQLIPESAVGSAAVGILATLLIGLAATRLTVSSVRDYGWGLFVGLPFFLGLTSVLIYGFHRPRSLGSCLCVALCSVGLICVAIFAVAIEGIICLVMAAPLGGTLALLGGFIGYIIQRRSEFRSESLHAYALILIAVPGFIMLERAAKLEPALREVHSSVEISAPPGKVWKHLIAFNELPAPAERLFHTGIAYPIRAEINGQGVGAVRRCIFSTGAFVEPITVWDEPKTMRFSVLEQPPVMDEMSPYPHLHPPHLKGYLQSREGQFLLKELTNGHTMLEGTTWYQNSFWPGLYWNVWSDYIIHRIHMRVLDHIKEIAEQQ